MDHSPNLEQFYRCPGCYGRLASHWFSGYGDDFSYVVCYNPACQDFSRYLPVGYGVRLMESQMTPQLQDHSTYYTGFLTDHATFSSCTQDAEFTGQNIQPMPSLHPSMLTQAPSSYQPSVAEDTLEECSENLSTAEPTASAPKQERRAILEKPLSELTLHSPEPMLTIEAYVNRPVEARLDEAVAKGRVMRPLNAFMLYMKAYQAHSKIYCEKDHAKFVSQVVAKSWKLETEEIRNRFVDLAKMENVNHRLAHPGYKFTWKIKK